MHRENNKTKQPCPGSPQKLGRPVHQNTFTSNSGHIQERTQPQNKQVASFTWDMALF